MVDTETKTAQSFAVIGPSRVQVADDGSVTLPAEVL